MTTIILDTETTGVKDAEVVELAWAEIKTVAPFLWHREAAETRRFQNEKPMQWGALATHHILPTDLLGCPPSSEARMPECTYLIGHNIDFDWKMLGSPPVKRICTMALARFAYPDCDSHSQSALMYYIFGARQGTKDLLRNAHSAEADILNCYALLLELITKLNIKSIEELYSVSEAARIPTVMPFGKHKGALISTIDEGYKNWYRRQAETDPYILMAFSKKK